MARGCQLVLLARDCQLLLLRTPVMPMALRFPVLLAVADIGSRGGGRECSTVSGRAGRRRQLRVGALAQREDFEPLA